MSPKNKPQKVLTLKKLLKVVNPIKKSAPDSYPIGKPKYPDAYSKLSTMKPSPQKKIVKKWTWPEIKKAINYVYDAYHHKDDWGVEVIYRQSMIQRLRSSLPSVNKKSK